MKANCALFVCHLLLIFCRHADAVLVNKTIDDKFGDRTTKHVISYSPVGSWNDGTNCERCSARPDNDMFVNRTWTDSTFSESASGREVPGIVPTASVGFNGTAVYVLCALARSKSNPYGNSDMRFFIDGHLAGTFSREAPGTPGYEYNVTVFSIANLLPTEHIIMIQNGHSGGPPSLMLLDAIVYTQENGELEPGSPSSSTISTTGLATSTIIAIVLGGIGGVSLGGLAFFLYRRSRQLRNTRQCIPYTYNPSIFEVQVPVAEAPPSYGGVPHNVAPGWLKKTHHV
ncbi:hypothetical protein AB1N83_012707 [Pleurotus pulmonarius]